MLLLLACTADPDPPADGTHADGAWSVTLDVPDPVDTDTGDPVDTDTGEPVDTDTGEPVDTDTGEPVDTDTGPPDLDADGVPADLDCDDADATVFPGATETCDGRDEDCDGAIDEDAGSSWYTDLDGDGVGDTAYLGCTPGALTGGDCDDTDPTVFPGAAETCDERDEDCDGTIDEDAGSTWFTDLDGDGAGDASYFGCTPGALTGGDCDDADATVFPGATETCDTRDEDCDGEIDEDAGDLWYSDLDGDGAGGAAYIGCTPGVATDGDCDDIDGTIFPGATETCDGRDEDCDGETDEDAGQTWYSDVDADGYGDTPYVSCTPGATVAGDCDDDDAEISPAADERCNGRDDDCDGMTDEDDAVDAPTWHFDLDGDRYGDPATAQGNCDQPTGWVADATDCDDTIPWSHPGAVESVDGHDNDCDGTPAGPCEPWADSIVVKYGDSVDMTFVCAGVDEGQRLTLSGTPSGATWNATTRRLTWTPTMDDFGVHELQIADDDESTRVTIEVIDSDQVVFDSTYVHEVDIEIAGDEMLAINAEATDWQEVNVTYDGERFESAGVRATGRLGSARDFPSKVAVKIDFREFGVDQRLHGLQRLGLHNMVQDCAKVKELAAYGAHRLLGIPAPRIAYAHVTFNGDDYGLYSVIEAYDDEFLEANFEDPSGNLYDGDYYLYPGTYSYELVDFLSSTMDFFQLDEGTDVGLEDVEAVVEAMHEGDFATDVGALVDLDEHAAFLAANAWTGQYDSYSYYRNNYRVYFDPGRGGKAVFLPWDPDWAFYSGTPVLSAYGVISAKCLSDATCRAAAHDYAKQLSAEIPGGPLQTEVEDAIALIDPYLSTDPKLEGSVGSVHTCQADLLDWFSRRDAELDAVGF